MQTGESIFMNIAAWYDTVLKWLQNYVCISCFFFCLHNIAQKVQGILFLNVISQTTLVLTADT